LAVLPTTVLVEGRDEDGFSRQGLAPGVDFLDAEC
jgi:hypothetical protein